MKFTRVLLHSKPGVIGGNSFYVTTPIYYVNAAPHIGHLYSSVIADAAGRWRRLRDVGVKFKFATGCDEHGSKIQQAAMNNKVSLPEYCENISGRYKELAERFGVGYTDFVRTSQESHKKAVRSFWQTIYDRGHIYSSKYSGWYCVPDETFLVETQLKESLLPNGKKIMVSAESGHPVEWTEEDNYLFKLQNFADDLKYWLQKDNVVRPKKFQKILLDMLDEGLPDVSVSRPSNRVHWGIKVPGDETQTVYVWLDALVNYLTAAGYPDESFKNFWPADLHVIGKDILKFHGIYWPAFLMAADVDPPRSLLCHSHWTVDGEKMSKSRQNVVCPFERSGGYTTDGLRYFLLREGVAHSDGNYSDVKVVRILNSELADTLGNLLSRCCGQALNPNQIFPELNGDAFEIISKEDVTRKLIDAVAALPAICEQHYNEHNFYKSVDAIVATLHVGNLFFETLKPWELKKKPDGLEQLNAVLHLTLETLRVSAILLSPIVPGIAENLLNKANVPGDRRTWDSSLKLSWNDTKAFHPERLSAEKVVLFKRILADGDAKKIKLRK